MFWRSVVGKLAVTILLLVSFVLLILSTFLLEFFKDFHTDLAETDLMQTAEKVSAMVEEYDDNILLHETINRVKNPSSRVAVIRNNEDLWVSPSDNGELNKLTKKWITAEPDLIKVLNENKKLRKQTVIPGTDTKIMIVGTPLTNHNGAVFVYQSLEVIATTKAETTKIIYLAAGIAIVLTTIFAFFLSTRITSPLIKMQEAVFDLTRGEFNTKVPILTHDEIGELAMAFNRMGRQLKFHINALRQEKEQLASILSSLADGVITLNRNGDMIATNPPAEHFIEDLYFENNMIYNAEGEQLPAVLNEIFDEVIHTEKEVLKEISLQGRSWVMIMTPLYDQKYVRGAVAVIRDMTEERTLDKLRKDFIANVSHELRTPISMLQGYSEAIVDDIAETKEDKNELAQIIHDESLRMGRLVNELLDLARMEAGHIQLHKEPVQLDVFTERILKKFKRVSDDNDIKLVLEKELENNIAMIDIDRMEQVFTNLIDNAIRHTNEYGYVKVVIKSLSDELYAAIEDNGSGIPEEDLPFIFERFYKADKSRVRNQKKKGTGLGLAIAKNIVDAHQGMITVKSKLNLGTTFIIRIPNKE